ncbi:GNAT family N-acetyltransferase [Streptomyces sp. NRRL S-350]|uniref:GNAT family N-acetyltransferase n=1 Tax=Streptomyces sp. NRRL S-350 TaxID=1463902 RepID=UPI00068A95CD|nr:GNAT family N-acetyltransferase [Streptomyces sp. NRRL S-350]
MTVTAQPTAAHPTAAHPTVEGLLLRPFEDTDAPALIEIHRDETLRRFIRNPVEGPEQAAAWLALQHEGWAAGTRFSFAVLDADELVGTVVLKRGTPGGDTAEVGYWTAGPARGRGVAPRAVEALTAWAFAAFEADGLHRIDLLHAGDNHASCRVAEKSGYRLAEIVPAFPPYPLDGHRHSRNRLDGSGRRRSE